MCGSKLNHQGTTGFSPWFHLPGFHFGYLFLTSHIVESWNLPFQRRCDPATPSNPQLDSETNLFPQEPASSKVARYAPARFSTASKPARGLTFGSSRQGQGASRKSHAGLRHESSTWYMSPSPYHRETSQQRALIQATFLEWKKNTPMLRLDPGSTPMSMSMFFSSSPRASSAMTDCLTESQVAQVANRRHCSAEHRVPFWFCFNRKPTANPSARGYLRSQTSA